MTSELDSSTPGPAERHRNRRFYWQVGLLAVLAVIAGATARLSRELGAPDLVQTVVIFLPLIPVGWALAIAVRFVARSDEWERSVYLTAASVGFVAVMGASAILGLAQAAGLSLGLFGWTALVLVGVIAFGVTISIKSKR